MVVGIIPTRETKEPAEVRKWYSEGADLRMDGETAQQVLAFLDKRRIERIVRVERIIGCPHEQGIDYPEGERCPECPSCAKRDRWTGERLD